jgi:hypothetical protein
LDIVLFVIKNYILGVLGSINVLNARKTIMDKSFVTMATCPICQKDTGTILLDRRLKARFDMHTPTPEPCDNCKKNYLKKGVLLLNPHTGALVVIKNKAFRMLFNKSMPKNKVAFCEQEILDYINNSIKGGEKNGS